MITIDKVNKEIASYMLDSELKDDRGKKVIGKKIRDLREAIMYLETSPNESFIKSEISRISSIIKAKSDGYQYWTKNICEKNVDVSKRKSLFNSQLGITSLKRQLKKLKYIV